jgi:uncharacterized membrane protein
MTREELTGKAKRLLYKWAHAPEYVYLIVALVGVIGFAFLTPPFQGPDEEAHYVRVQYIAHGYFIPVSVNDSNAALPKSLETVLKTTFYNDDLRGKTADKYELGRTKSAITTPLDSQVTYKPAMISYGAVPYLPAVPGVFIANSLNANPLVSMYIARLSLGIASVILMFFAIKFIPYKKYLFVVVGLIPMLLFQQAMVTIDGVSYALLALFISYVLYLNKNSTIRRKQWLILAAICVGLVLVKPLIWLFLPLVFILVKKKYALRWIIGIGVACIVFFAGLGILSTIKSQAASDSSLPSNVNSSLQIHNLVTNPTRILRVGWNTYMTTYGDEEVRGVIGIFGPADTLYPLWMFTLYVIVLGLACFLKLDEKKDVVIAKKWKILAGVIAVVYFGAVNLALYLSYTPINFDIVYGVQGRYFLPIVIVAAAVIFTGGIRVNRADTSKIKIFLTIAVSCLTILALYTVLQRYYLYTP